MPFHKNAPMVRFRRDVGSLFNFVKASALLHQAQRQVDDQGRVIATVDDYAFAYPIFSKVMAESAGKAVPDNVRLVVELIAKRAEQAKPTDDKPSKMVFTRQVAVAGQAQEVTISRVEIGTATGIGAQAAYRAVHTAINLGFLTNNEVRAGKPYRLALKRKLDEPDTSLLPDPATICQEGGAP